MKSVLITGAGSGLGRGTAIGLARAGHRVFATTQLWAQATDLQKEVEKLADVTWCRGEPVAVWLKNE